MSDIYFPTTNLSDCFQKWRLALANVRNGTASARVLFPGDSTSEGTGSSGAIPETKSLPSRLAQLLAAAGTPAAVGLGVPPTASSTNGRWSVGSGWSPSPSSYGAANASNYVGVPTTGDLIYTPSPQVQCDGFWVYWLGSPSAGVGTLTCTASGGSPNTFNTYAVASNGTYRTWIQGTLGTSNTLTIVATNGNSYVVGVEPGISTKSQVLVGNAGIGGTTSGVWNNAGTFKALEFIKAVAPDLTVISLGINDATSTVSTSTYQTNIQAIITAAQISGDVLLCDMPPSSSSISGGSTTLTYEQDYLPILQSLASSNNCAYASINSRWGNTYNAPFMSDAAHPNDAGYTDWAQFLANIIGTP